MSMSPILCPCCQSAQVKCRNIGRKAGSALGILFGAAGVVSSLSAMTGVPGSVILGHAAQVLMKAMVGGASGCAVGAALGEVVDDNILENYRCRSCRHSFSVKRG